jgi:hypothetical protein
MHSTQLGKPPAAMETATLPEYRFLMAVRMTRLVVFDAMQSENRKIGTTKTPSICSKLRLAANSSAYWSQSCSRHALCKLVGFDMSSCCSYTNIGVD